VNTSLVRVALLAPLLAPLLAVGSDGSARQERVPTGLRFVSFNAVTKGKSDEADALTTRMRSYLQANHPRLDMHPLRDYSPVTKRVTWIMNFMNMPDMETTMGQLDQEEGWLALGSQKKGVFDQEQNEFHIMLPVVQREPPGPPMVFWWRRTARVDPPDLARGLRMARAEAEYVNAKYPAVRMEVYSGVGGDLGWIFWFCEFGSADVWRDVQTRLWADDDYLDLMENAAELFEGASWVEQIDTMR